jgi:hypothetical protein
LLLESLSDAAVTKAGWESLGQAWHHLWQSPGGAKRFLRVIHPPNVSGLVGENFDLFGEVFFITHRTGTYEANLSGFDTADSGIRRFLGMPRFANPAPFFSCSTQTDAQGNYRFDGLAPERLPDAEFLRLCRSEPGDPRRAGTHRITVKETQRTSQNLELSQR